MRVSRRANVDRYYLFQCRWFAIFLHHIHHDEKPGIYHTHPWSWFSIIFGRYDDYRIARPPQRRWFFNYCFAGVPHRVTLPRGPVWTLCFHGPRRCQWLVSDEHGATIEVEPWTGTENAGRKDYA